MTRASGGLWAYTDCQRPIHTSLRSPETATTTASRPRIEHSGSLGRLEGRDRGAGAGGSREGDRRDAVHDATVRAWTRFATLRDRSSFDAWFDRILVNGCRDRWRRRGVRPISLPDLPDLPERPTARSSPAGAWVAVPS